MTRAKQDLPAALAASKAAQGQAKQQLARDELVAEMLGVLIYLRDCIETGKEPGMGIVHAAIRKAQGKS